MALVLSTTDLISSLEESPDIVSWINDTLTVEDGTELSLTDLDQHVNHLVSTLDLACEDTSSELERLIDDVSRGVPRLAYDLHFMKDGALSLQSVLADVAARSRDAVPLSTRTALDRLQLLDTIKTRMEAAREVLREAESWSTLELEVTSLLAEKSYAKAAERLSEASRSMAVFQNTPEYDPRKTLMVNLQNQLEAALSSALVAAINTHDLAACRNYFSIFSHIQRESEFRNYYNGSRRASVVAVWQDTRISDCDTPPDSNVPTLAEFVPRFYAAFLALLKPTFSQRLASIFSHYGDAALKELIPVFRATEDFASGVDIVMEKIKYSAVLPTPLDSSGPSLADGPPGHARRRSSRLSMSWRSTPARSTSSGIPTVKSTLSIPQDDLEWEQELFQPFLDFQIISSDTRDKIPGADRARLLRERAVDIFSVAEESVARCTAFTHGYGAVGLVQALDGFFQSFIDMWTADVRLGSSSSAASSTAEQLASGEDLSDLDYTSEDWADFQLSLHLLSSARAVFDRMMAFETKLRSNLAQIATTFRLARNDPTNFVIASSKGESQLLEQSALNSAELHALLDRVDLDSGHSTAGQRHPAQQSGPSSPLLVDAREGVFSFAKACQVSLQETILSPLRKHLASYASSPLWSAPGDPKAKRTLTATDLAVPSFSLSPSDTVHKISEGLLNLPRLFDVYADDDALSFSLHTLPHVDPEILKSLAELTPLSVDTGASPGHKRRQSLTATPKPAVAPPPTALDPELVSSAWLSSLGHTLLTHLTTAVLPNIATLSPAGAAQLASDLGYLSTIVRALNVVFEDLDRWKEYAELDDEEGRKRVAGRELEADGVFQNLVYLPPLLPMQDVTDTGEPATDVPPHGLRCASHPYASALSLGREDASPQPPDEAAGVFCH
ncbi:Expansin-like EG45 domain-containing protein [Mycena sanguinolenta]|uniref:Conserved oligomeric Golgi complex subunit 7 n=1 Tax=Mycena sanguinolenta TaxID=230812 RepID=A0A8H7DL29_9AGAR|nr:Expansin-like EG45 domain-containing protein [Mycena sanguinolenta]